ncbi:serine threonine-protein kinase [Nesidiocoris tenuis]|uniref:Aurora kinase n=1 Tax=Nesidiocoris tenuis TaxID=355587 RepID=A0ABN7AMA0_9HEMI|nr:serine threonine-protein kinase [Nesidiocoris tenuis]
MATEEPDDRVHQRKWTMDDFELGNVIGCGRFGKVLHAVEKESRIGVAIKVIAKSSIADDMKNQVFHELAVHSLLRHPNIIPLYTFFHNQQSICIVMEYAAGNSLHSLMRKQKYKRFSEELAAKYICQMAKALDHMHNRVWMHRDVKPENVLIDGKGDAKLGDFGYVISSVRRRHGVCGTHEYMAPEVLLNKPYDHTVDIWCLGVMAFELLVGRDPFRSNKPKITQKRILQRKIVFPAIVKPDAVDLIQKLIVVDPKKRLALKQTINHVWITNNYVQTVQSR